MLESSGVGYMAVRRGRDRYRAMGRVESIWRGWWPRGGGERSGDLGLSNLLRIFKRWYLRISLFIAFIITLYVMNIFIQFYAMQLIYMMLHNILLL